MAKNYVPAQTGIFEFWRSASTQIPIFSAMAFRWLSVPISSVDVERTFSAYNSIFSDRRRNLTVEHMKQLSALYFNSSAMNRPNQNQDSPQTSSDEEAV